MPTIPMPGPYRFFFYSGDRDEPPHVHVEREGGSINRRRAFGKFKRWAYDFRADCLVSVFVNGTKEEQNHWRFIADGKGIHWADLDKDISTENLILGKPSGESQHSFKQGLPSRMANR